MRAIALSAVLCALCGAQVTSRFNATLAAMAAALAENNAPAFLESIDPAMPGYDRLKASVEALTAQADVHSGIDQIAEDGDEVQVDWAMRITTRGDASQTEQRRASVRIRFAHNGKKWRVISLTPAAFFGPPRVAEGPGQ